MSAWYGREQLFCEFDGTGVLRCEKRAHGLRVLDLLVLVCFVGALAAAVSAEIHWA